MTRDEYEKWCRDLHRCPASGGKVVWPLRVLAERAAELMEGPNSGVYRHRPCGGFHITRNLEDRLSRGQKQRANQPETTRLKQKRQRAARRARERNA